MPLDLQDKELIDRFIAGEEIAFNRLVHKYQSKIYWHARRMTGNHFDADDVLQDVLVILYKKVKDFNSASSLYTWIYKITSNTAINLINKRKVSRFFSIDDDDAADLTSADDFVSNLESKEKLAELDNILVLLPPKQREVFVLRHFEELSYEEISDVTGTSVGSLKASYFHALNKVLKYGDKKDE